MRKLASLLNKEGFLLLYSTLRESSGDQIEGFYTVNGKKIHDLALKKEFVFEGMH